jgi:nucleoside recognition membrane protein YjiH
MNDRAFRERWAPRVPRHWLFAIAGMIWTGVGSLLCYRAVGWYTLFVPPQAYLFEGLGAGLAVAGYVFGFSRITRKNIRRIHGLPERVCLFAFTAWRGYVMIGLMITIGVLLRNSSLPKEYLAVPYMTMGGALLLGSLPFYAAFLKSASHAGGRT